MKKTAFRNAVALAAAITSVAAAASDILTVSADMTINEDRTVAGIVFTTGATLSGTGKITIDSVAGITVEAGTATIASDVEFAAGAATVTNTVGDTGVLVQTGVWSGSSPITLMGQGVAKSSQPQSFYLRGANTFTGKLILRKARVYAYGDGAFGTTDARTEWIADGNDGSLLYFCGGEWNEDFQVTSFAGGYKGWFRSARTYNSTTNIFNGRFDLQDPSYMAVGADSIAIFAGIVSGRNTYLPDLAAGSVVILTNSATISTVEFGPSGTGTYYVHGMRTGGYGTTAEHSIKCRVVCMKENWFNCMSTRGGAPGDGGVIDLNGYDQKGGLLKAGHARGTITSPTPATWHVDMGRAFTNANVFTGAVNLEKKGGSLLALSSVSTSTGTLTVAAGDMAFVGGGFWTGDINVDVGNLEFNSLVNFEASQTIRIAEGAKVVLNGGNLNAQNVYYNGGKLAVGEYSKANGDAFVDGDFVLNVIAAPIVAETVTWTGEGSGDLITTAANWGAGRESPPDFSAGLTTAVFADSGSRAVLPGNAAFAGLSFKPVSGTAAFTVADDPGDAILTVGSGGITIDDSSNSFGAYVVEPFFNLGVAARFAGKGRLDLRGGGSFDGKLIVTNTSLRLTGTFNAPFGITFCMAPKADSHAELQLSNATIKVGSTSATQLYPYGVDRYYPLRALAGTTNRVEGRCQIDAVSRPIFFSNSQTTFAGPCSWGSYVVPYGYPGARVIFEGPLTAYDFSSATASGDECTYVFRATGNKFSSDRWGCRMRLNTGARVRTEVENAFNYNFEKLHLNGGTLDLAGCSQHFGPLVGKSLVTSESNAVLHVNQVVHTIEDPIISGPTTNTVRFAGGASLEKAGALDMYLGGVSSTTGTLEVTEGMLSFADGGAWTNCSAVAASGSGRLVIPAAHSFNRYADVYVTSGGGATVEIAAGVTHTCRYVFLNGVRQRVGNFSAATHPDWFSGGGVLRSLGLNSGTMVVVK